MQSGMANTTVGGSSFLVQQIEGQDVATSGGSEANFERVKAQLMARLGNDVYSSWFGRMKVAEASRGLVRLSVPTAFLRQWIKAYFVAWPIAAATAFLFMPTAQRITGRIMGAFGGG